MHESAAAPKREQAAIRRFARQIEQDGGYPSRGCYCKHGVQGGLFCEWCHWVDRLPDAEKLRGPMAAKP